MARRQRIDSADQAVRIAQQSGRPIAPPSHVPLEEVDWPYWESVVAEFARAEWTEHQLEIAAMLARTMANLEQEQRSLRAEGFTSESQRGTPVINPRVMACKSLSGDILAFRRSLALHARGRNSGDNRSAATRRDGAKAREVDHDDELFAIPN